MLVCRSGGSFSLHVHWLARYTGALECPVMQDLMGQRHVGPNWGKDSTSSPHFPRSNGFIEQQVGTTKTALTTAQAAKKPLEDILLDLTCCSMKPLDLGKWGKDVECSMWCHWRNEQAPQTKRAGHCPLRAGTVACTEISVLAGVHIETGWTWFLPCTRRGTC